MLVDLHEKIKGVMRSHNRSVTSCLCIDKIPEVAKTKVSNQRDMLYWASDQLETKKKENLTTPQVTPTSHAPSTY